MPTDTLYLPKEADVLTIWPGTGIPPNSAQATWQEQASQPPDSSIPNEMARNVVIPTLTRFNPSAGAGNGTALIVAPGGAFHFLMMYHEGYEVAEWLTTLGITAFVLKYRLYHTPPQEAEFFTLLERLGGQLPPPDAKEIDPPIGFPELEATRLWAEADGRQAIRFVRQQAAVLAIDPNKIGILGFSAGGGVAINAALEYDPLSRPNFAAGIYPAYRKGPLVPVDAPPLFIAIADDDDTVAPISFARLYKGWHQAGKSVELHIFANGGHGFGMRQQNQLSDQWTGVFKYWLASQGYIA